MSTLKERVLRWMRKEFRHEGFETADGLAEAAASNFDHDDWLLSDDHWVFGLARQVVPAL